MPLDENRADREEEVTATETTQAPKERDAHRPILKARKVVFVGVILLFVCGFALQIGIGGYADLGIGNVAAICPLGWLETLVAGKVLGFHQVIAIAATLVLILLLGKAFCSWVCPTPYIQKLLSKKKPITADGESENQRVASASCSSCSSPCSKGSLPPVGGKRDGIKIDTRHAVLAGTLGSAAIFGFPVFCLVCPIGLTFATFAAVWHLLQFNETTWGLIAFPAIVILELVVLKKWCHKICPISAVTSLISNGNKIFRPRVKKDQCLRNRGIDCRTCVEVCPEYVDPHESSIPECTKCGACVELCPTRAIKIK